MACSKFLSGLAIIHLGRIPQFLASGRTGEALSGPLRGGPGTCQDHAFRRTARPVRRDRHRLGEARRPLRVPGGRVRRSVWKDVARRSSRNGWPLSRLSERASGLRGLGCSRRELALHLFETRLRSWIGPKNLFRKGGLSRRGRPSCFVAARLKVIIPDRQALIGARYCRLSSNTLPCGWRPRDCVVPNRFRDPSVAKSGLGKFLLSYQ